MKLYLNKHEYINTSEPIDLSIPLSASDKNPIAWYVSPPTMEPVRTKHYTGSVQEGGSVNFRDIYFNPHGHGTHTECLGHITQEVYSINDTLKEFFCEAALISVTPKEVKNAEEIDTIIYPEQLQWEGKPEAIIIRTLPNTPSKKNTNYSSTNPTYFDVSCVEKLIQHGIKHILVDLPSVDRENDKGALAFHHAFWGVPMNPNFERTITELIYVPNEVEDGLYVLELQVAAFENDAAPSRPILYKKRAE